MPSLLPRNPVWGVMPIMAHHAHRHYEPCKYFSWANNLLFSLPMAHMGLLLGGGLDLRVPKEDDEYPGRCHESNSAIPTQSREAGQWSIIRSKAAGHQSAALYIIRFFASQAVKETLKGLIGEMSTFGWRTDLQLEYEGRNLEFKIDGLSSKQYRKEYLRNIIINRAIMEDNHSTCGARPAIYFMCITGWVGVVFGLHLSCTEERRVHPFHSGAQLL
ncbi:hypothetical protein B0O80DRAFT_531353 [Mortierella sp. GBAus27b]|nr:hypothetical protein B0O80DRAFT_531353 [Mortierella sp. GBAus27b]